jgi:glutathione S-transferase
LDELWLHRRPRVVQWFARVRERPSFQHAITGVRTDRDKERLRVARDESWPPAREILGIN